tara:strand:- start:2241 stop:3638 length:1398 start_codon:yes stop_codon:yes gene_type:complete
MKTAVRITSNIKSRDGESWSYDLDENNLLVGPNESGKSSIAEALQLAIGGTVSDILLRGEVKSGSDLSTLIPIGESIAFAEVEFSDGTTRRWELERGKRAKHTGPSFSEAPLPMVELKTALRGSEDTITKFFFEHLMPTVSLDALKSATPFFSEALPDETLKELLPDYGPNHNALPLWPEAVLEMVDKAKKTSRACKSRGKALDEMLEQLCVVHPGTDNLLDLWEELTVAIQFEYIGKMYKGGGEERDVFKPFLQKLGTVEELKNLRGSAIIHDEITGRIRDRAIFDQARRIRDEALEMNKRSKDMSIAASTLSGAIRALTNGVLAPYMARVNDYLPDGDGIFFELEKGSFRWGLWRTSEKGEAGVHRALSGSTEARVLGAMAAALTPPGQPAMVIIDDRMWDTATLSRTMAAMEEAPCQVVMMTTQKPRGRKRSGWEYIELEKASTDKNEATHSNGTEQVAPAL